jgi:hypothetical protein
MEERARLAQLLGDEATTRSRHEQAFALYEELGASGHAQRLAAEL